MCPACNACRSGFTSNNDCTNTRLSMYGGSWPSPFTTHRRRHVMGSGATRARKSGIYLRFDSAAGYWDEYHVFSRDYPIYLVLRLQDDFASGPIPGNIPHCASTHRAPLCVGVRSSACTMLVVYRVVCETIIFFFFSFYYLYHSVQTQTVTLTGAFSCSYS